MHRDHLVFCRFEDSLMSPCCFPYLSLLIEYYRKGLDASCNVNCGCSKRVLQPVCSSDKVTNYFSPCFAGCSSSFLDPSNNLTTFGGCSCDAFGTQVTQGYCPVECNTFTPYLTFLTVAKFISSTSRTGNYLVRFRSVEERDKSFAMGIGMTIFGLFG